MSPTLVLDADAGRHIDDDDLVRILDGESATSSAWSGHFSGCAECRTKMTELSGAAFALREAYQAVLVPEHLAELPLRLRVRERAATPAPSFWLPGSGAKRAAGILLFAVVGTAAAATIQRLVRDAGTAESVAPLPAVVAAPVGIRVDTSSIAFPVSSDVITLDFASVPGLLSARLGSSDTLRLLVTSRDSLNASPAEPALIALPDGIRIGNALTSRAAYDVILPAGAQELRVRLGGRPVGVLRRPGMSAERNVAVPVEGRVSPP